MAESAKQLLYGNQKESAKDLLYGKQSTPMPGYINPNINMGQTAKQAETPVPYGPVPKVNPNYDEPIGPPTPPLWKELNSEFPNERAWANTVYGLKELSEKIGKRADEANKFYGQAPAPYRDGNIPLTKAEQNYENQSQLTKMLSTAGRTAERYGLGIGEFATSLPAKVFAPELFLNKQTNKPATELLKQEGKGFLQMMTDLPAQALYIGARAIGLQPEQADDIPELIDGIVKKAGLDPNLRGQFRDAVNRMYEAPESPIFAAQIGKSAVKGALPKKTDVTKEAQEFSGYDPLKYRYEDLQVVDQNALPNPKGQPRTQPADIVRGELPERTSIKRSPQKENLGEKEFIPDNAIEIRPEAEFKRKLSVAEQNKLAMDELRARKSGSERGSVAPPSTKPQKPSKSVPLEKPSVEPKKQDIPTKEAKAGTKPEQVSTPKEPWEMTREEFERKLESAKTAEIIETEIDFGYKRGQGKRSGGMVKGSMSDMKGVQKRQALKVNVPDFEQIKGDLKGRDLPFINRYQKARNAGLNHREAMGFAIKGVGIQELFIKQALSKGKPVPKEVLADYPELAKSPAVEKPAPATDLLDKKPVQVDKLKTEAVEPKADVKPAVDKPKKSFGEFRDVDLTKQIELPSESDVLIRSGMFGKKSESGVTYGVLDKMATLDNALRRYGHRGLVDKAADFKGIFSLDKILDNKELFKKYPTLKNINILFADFHTSKKAGLFVKEQNTIYINSKRYLKDKESLRGTIVHEIQHAKQDISGMIPEADDMIIRDAKGQYKKQYNSEREIDARRKQKEYLDYIKSQDKPVSVNKGDIITPIGLAIAGTALSQDDDDLVKAGMGIFALTGLMRSPLKDKGGKKLSEVQKQQLIDRINKEMKKAEANIDKTRQMNQTAYENLKEYERRKAGVPKKDNEPIMSPEDAEATIRKAETEEAVENKKAFKEYRKKVAEPQTEAGRLASQIINKDIIPLLDKAPKMRDIGVTDVGRKAIYRNTRRVFGKDAEKILEPFDKAKERMVSFVKDRLNEVKTKVWKDLGIKPSTSLSAAVQKYGEQNMKESYKNELQFIEDIIKSEKPTGKYKKELLKYREDLHKSLKKLSGYDYQGLVKRYGQKKADDIVKADTYFRTTYDNLLNEINDVRTQIKPGTPDEFAVVKKGAEKNKSGDLRAYRVFDTKAEADNFVNSNENKTLSVEVRPGKSEAIPKRKDYYRHFRELSGGLGDLVTLLDSPDQISAKLVNISEFTHPKTKWTSIAQRRKGIKTDFDAVKGFVDYINHAAFAIHMDPMVTFFKNFNEGLRESTDGVNNINNYIKFIDYFQQHLAGKTNPYDRFLQEHLTGRRGLRILNYVNGRIASNTVGLSVSTLLVQPANLAQGIAEAKQYVVPGGLLTLASPFMKNAPQKLSPFLNERYLSTDLDSFNRFSWWRHIKNSKKVSGLLMNYADAVGTNMIWNSLYLKAKSQKMKDPIRYADNKTRDMVGGRGIGEMGLVFKSVGGRIFLNFQYEVDNLWQVMKDWTTEKQFGTLLTFFLSAYVMNKIYEEILGRPVLVDFVQTGVDIAEIAQNDSMGAGEKVAKSIGRGVGEVLTETAGGQLVAQLIPKETRQEFFSKDSDPARYGDPAAMLRTLRDAFQSGTALYQGKEDRALYEAGNVASKLALPTGGGQIKKTTQGINAVQQGRVFNSKGKTQYFIDVNDPAEVAKALFFGPYATESAREYYKKRGQR